MIFSIQKLDEIFEMDDQKKKNVGRFRLVPNLRPRFKNLEKKEKKKRSTLDSPTFPILGFP
jgi:hypothetical protein